MIGWISDAIDSKPTTAANSKYRSESESVALEGGRLGILRDSVGAKRLSSVPCESTWVNSRSSAA